MAKSNFQETIWVAGKELKLIHVYDSNYVPSWDTQVETDYYSYTANPSPVFIHRGNLHGYYNEVNANTEVTE